jgi:DNA mismatch repair protein MutL
MIFFVNGRCVRSNDLSSWMGEAFAKFFTKKRPLHCFLFLIIPQSQIDINVHPAKMEVRFSRRAALRELLLHAFGEHFASLGKSIWSAPPAETDLHSKNFCGSSEEFGCPEEFSKNGGAMDVNWGQPAPQGVKTSSRGPKAMGWRYVAMFDRRCALLSSGNGIVFFDVGAAAAHLADKKLRKEISAAGNRQRLLAPIAIDLSAAGGGSEKLDGKIRELGEMGFSAAKAGEESISVAEIPQWLDGRRCEMFIWRWLSGNGSGHPCDAEVAKAAVGGETQLSPWGESEVLNLLDALLSDGDAPPHLYFEISRGEVARRLANFGNCQIHGVLGD